MKLCKQIPRECAVHFQKRSRINNPTLAYQSASRQLSDSCLSDVRCSYCTDAMHPIAPPAMPQWKSFIAAGYAILVAAATSTHLSACSLGAAPAVQEGAPAAPSKRALAFHERTNGGIKRGAALLPAYGAVSRRRKARCNLSWCRSSCRGTPGSGA